MCSSWYAMQKGAIENANKRIRKYIPKKASFNNFSKALIQALQYKINDRPRLKLDFMSPKSAFFSHFP